LSVSHLPIIFTLSLFLYTELFVIVVRYKFWQDAENKQRLFILVELSIQTYSYLATVDYPSEFLMPCKLYYLPFLK